MQPSDDIGSERENRSMNDLDVPKLAVMRRRVLVGLALGVAGVCFGIASVAFAAPLLSIAAALCAVGGCGVALSSTLLPMLRLNKEADQLQHRIDAVTTNRMPGDLTSHSETQSVIDPVTELPDGRYFEVAVESRVAAARRHLWPVSIVLLQLGFDKTGVTAADRNRSLGAFANMMRQTLREADIACRIDENTFGLILEDTSEEGGVWTAERLQIALAHDTTHIRRLVAGVAAYPTHGLFSKDVLVRAEAALHRASATPAGHGLGQVEVAHVDLS